MAAFRINDFPGGRNSCGGSRTLLFTVLPVVMEMRVCSVHVVVGPRHMWLLSTQHRHMAHLKFKTEF